MDDVLLEVVLRRLEESPLPEEVTHLLLAALEDEESLSAQLGGQDPERPSRDPASAVPAQPAGAYLRSLTVTGFRGIGQPAALSLAPSPGREETRRQDRWQPAMTPEELLAAARRLIERPDAAPAGVWPRAAALLIRQALEQAMTLPWAAEAQATDLSGCSMRSQVLCLTAYLDRGTAAVPPSYWPRLAAPATTTPTN